MTGHDDAPLPLPQAHLPQPGPRAVHQPRDEPLHHLLPLRALLQGLRRRPRPRRVRRRTTGLLRPPRRTARSRASSRGNLVEVCPTGVFTDKTLKQHYTRKWDLHQRAVGVRALRRRLQHARRASATARCGASSTATTREVNGYFLCDRGRFGYEFVNRPERPLQPLMRSSFAASSPTPTPIAALERFAELLRQGQALRHRLAARQPRVVVRARARGRRQRVQPRHRRRRSRAARARRCAILARRSRRERLARGRAADATSCWCSAKTPPPPRRCWRSRCGRPRWWRRPPTLPRDIPRWHDAALREWVGHQARAVLHRLAAADATRRRGDALGASRRRRRRRARAGGGARAGVKRAGAARARDRASPTPASWRRRSRRRCAPPSAR